MRGRIGTVESFGCPGFAGSLLWTAGHSWHDAPAVYELRVYCDRCKARSELIRLAALPKADQMLPQDWGLVPTTKGPRQACPACADGLGPTADIQRAPHGVKG